MNFRSFAAKAVRLSVKPFRTEAVHLSRFLLYRSLKGYAANTKVNKVASISGSQTLCKLMGFETSSIIDLDYPDHDLRNLQFEDDTFDACIADQVLEHIEADPFAVIRECTRVVRPNGLVVHATVMTYPIHWGPRDLWRFTPDGLKTIFSEAGLSIEVVGSWGGVGAVTLLSLGLAQVPVPQNASHPIKRIACDSGSDWPIVVWVIGRKIKGI